MKKRLLCLLLLPMFCFGQSNLLKEFDLLQQSCYEIGEDHPDQGLQKSLRMMQIADELQNDSLRYAALRNKTSALGTLGIFDEALKGLFTMVKMREKNPSLDESGSIFYQLSLGYLAMEDFKNSYEFAVLYKTNAIQHQHVQDTIQANFQIGLNLIGLNKEEEGFGLLRKNIETARKLKASDVLMEGLDDLANGYFEKEDYAKALLYEKEAMNYISPDASLLEWTSVYEHLALMHIKLKQWAEAKHYADKALSNATQLNSFDWLYECYRDMADIEDAKGNFKAALDWHRKFVDTKDSVYKKQYDVKFASMTSLFQLEGKQKAISLLEAEKKLQQDKIYQLYGIVAFVLLLLLITILFIKNQQNKKEKLLKMEFSRQLIKNQEDERLRISKELHDSVGQNLLFIKNQINKWIQQPHATLTHSVDSALEEVRNISKDLYPNQLEKFGLVASINALCEKVNESTNVFTSHDIQLDDSKLDKEKKISCYRIIQECISNTLKHAQATALRITAEMKESQIEFVIQDNGKGFTQETRYLKAHRSFGLLNMEERVKIMRGKFHIESVVGAGTKTMVMIPI